MNGMEEKAAELGLEPDDYRELLELFGEAGRSDLEKLRTAVSSGDARAVEEASHSFKGASGNLGFEELHELAADIVRRARSGDMEGIDKLTEALTGRFNETMKSL